jgi:hypothetical protein
MPRRMFSIASIHVEVVSRNIDRSGQLGHKEASIIDLYPQSSQKRDFFNLAVH